MKKHDDDLRAGRRRREQVLDLVRLIPPGRVASYGGIARYVPGVSPRLVGFLMAGLAARTDVPWQRVINARGTVSAHAHAAEQIRLLEAEGVRFDADGRIDWQRFGWAGPKAEELVVLDLDPLRLLDNEAQEP
ncbi:MAG: cysteine methyltransferase [Alphaproteobacteria bacterium]|nr:MAG: cysteine methyltransferase [Alphaproteobacteria bacterium]